MKKFLALALTVLMVFGLAVPASAWSSGGIDHTHQVLTAKALVVVKTNAAIAGLITSTYEATLLQYSDWPDSYENDGGLYTSHFYNPYTGKSFSGSTTAMTRFMTHASNAKKYYAKSRTLAYQELGKALHYLADINEPHHAANLIAFFSNHTQYENWVDANEATFGPVAHLIPTTYDAKLNYTSFCTELFRISAFHAYDLSDEAKSSNTALWATSAADCEAHGTEAIAVFLRNFYYSVGAIKTPN